MTEHHTAENDAPVTVTLTGPQVRALHESLSMIEADPDWVDMLGGKGQMDLLYRAHNAILLARPRP